MKNFVLFRILQVRDYEAATPNEGWNAYHAAYSTLSDAVSVGLRKVYDEKFWYDFQVIDLSKLEVVMTTNTCLTEGMYKALKEMLEGEVFSNEWTQCVLDGTIDIENMQIIYQNVRYNDIDITWMKAAKEYNLRTLKKKVDEYLKFNDCTIQ